MKRIILLVGLTFSALAYSQIKKVEVEKCTEVGAIKPMGQLQISLEKCEDNRYVFVYSDAKYTKITDFKSFALKDENGDIDYIYNEIMKGLDTPPKEPIRLELPNDIIELHFVKGLGMVNVQFRHWVNKNPEVIGATIYLDKRRINKLFGKK